MQFKWKAFAILASAHDLKPAQSELFPWTTNQSFRDLICNWTCMFVHNLKLRLRLVNFNSGDADKISFLAVELSLILSSSAHSWKWGEITRHWDEYKSYLWVCEYYPASICVRVHLQTVNFQDVLEAHFTEYSLWSCRWSLKARFLLQNYYTVGDMRFMWRITCSDIYINAYSL